MTLLKDSKSKNIGEAIMGFGLLFMGLSGLSDVFKPGSPNSLLTENSLNFMHSVQGWGAVSIVISVIIGVVITALMPPSLTTGCSPANSGLKSEPPLMRSPSICSSVLMIVSVCAEGGMMIGTPPASSTDL